MCFLFLWTKIFNLVSLPPKPLSPFVPSDSEIARIPLKPSDFQCNLRSRVQCCRVLSRPRGTPKQLLPGTEVKSHAPGRRDRHRTQWLRGWHGIDRYTHTPFYRTRFARSPSASTQHYVLPPHRVGLEHRPTRWVLGAFHVLLVAPKILILRSTVTGWMGLCCTTWSSGFQLRQMSHVELVPWGLTM